MFLPRLRGTATHTHTQALAPGRIAVGRSVGASARCAAARTRPRREASRAPPPPLHHHHTRHQAALGNSSRSVAKRPLFLRVEPIRAMARHMVEWLTESATVSMCVVTAVSPEGWQQRGVRALSLRSSLAVAYWPSSRPASEQIRGSSSGPAILPGRPCVYVALNRGEAHMEGAGRLGLGHPAFYGGDYLLRLRSSE